MNPFRNLPHPGQSLKPVTKILLQELIHLVFIAKLRTALLKMRDPVETCVLNLRRKTLLNSTTLNVGYKFTGSIYTADISLKRGRYKPYIAFG